MDVWMDVRDGVCGMECAGLERSGSGHLDMKLVLWHLIAFQSRGDGQWQ